VTDSAAAGHGVRVPMVATRDAPEPAAAGPEYPGAASFRALHAAQFGFVFRVLARLGVPPSLLDDAAQEVFVVVYRRRKSYDPRTPLRSWLYGIARRVSADVRRGVMRSDRRLRAMPTMIEPACDPVEALRRREAEAIVEGFLAELDEDTRMVFVLVDIEGMTAPEVELALGVKLNTVYSRLRRARAAFARTIAATDEEGQP
jgi:RNA polymerase sigma-70 factor (ECF subfamily)